VVGDDREREFVSEIRSFVGDLFVFAGQCATSIGPVRAALLSTGELAMSALDTALSTPKESRGCADAANGSKILPAVMLLDARQFWRNAAARFVFK
jgi:hypothetical protein